MGKDNNANILGALFGALAIGAAAGAAYIGAKVTKKKKR